MFLDRKRQGKVALILQVYLHDPRKSDIILAELVEAAGAKRLSRPPPSKTLMADTEQGLQTDPHTAVLVAGKPSENRFAPPHDWHGVCISRNWLIDSASNYCVQPFEPYTLKDME